MGWNTYGNLLKPTTIGSTTCAHIEQMREAVADGVDVMGYTVWGVIDLVANTTLSVEKRYGLVYVDRHDDHTGDFSRYRKKSFDWYRHVIETNGGDLS